MLLLQISCFSHVILCVTPETAAHQAPPSLGFSMQEHWSGFPFPLSTYKKLKETEKSSVQFSHSAVSNSFRPQGLQHTSFPVCHQLPELAQTHVHQVSDTIQPSQPLLSPSPAFNLSQHRSLFKSVSSLQQADKLLELQLQHQSFLRIFRTGFL